jgi:hypothetical protein
LSPCAGYTGKVLDVKVISVEGLAIHDSPESCTSVGNHLGEALTGGGVGPVSSRERYEPLLGAEAVETVRRQNPVARNRERHGDPARSKTRGMRSNTLCGNREVPRLTQADDDWVRKRKPKRGDRR